MQHAFTQAPQGTYGEPHAQFLKDVLVLRRQTMGKKNGSLGIAQQSANRCRTGNRLAGMGRLGKDRQRPENQTRYARLGISAVLSWPSRYKACQEMSCRRRYGWQSSGRSSIPTSAHAALAAALHSPKADPGPVSDDLDILSVSSIPLPAPHAERILMTSREFLKDSGFGPLRDLGDTPKKIRVRPEGLMNHQWTVSYRNGHRWVTDRRLQSVSRKPCAGRG